MFYFIPAWYNPWRDWYDNTEPFYRPAMHGFDDTISQLRMFKKSGEEACLLVLSYMPNLRRFLHQYDLLEGSVWSLFDDIQNIVNPSYRLTDFKELNWPEGSEFIYSPFLVLVRHQGREIAKVEFGHEGNLIWIDFVEDSHRTYKYIFDDRGFVSSIITYQDGQEQYQDYLDCLGEWQIREYRLGDNRRVEVNPSQRLRFKKSEYDSIEELVKEWISDYFVKQLVDDDKVVVAAHNMNLHVYDLLSPSVKTVSSFYGNRFDITGPNLDKIVQKSNLFVADSLSVATSLQEKQLNNIQHISPFDTRLVLGKSQRLKKLIVHFIIDDLEIQELEEHLVRIFEVMEVNDKIYLSLVTYNHDFQKREEAKQFILDLLSKQKKIYLFLEDEEVESPKDILEEEEVQSRVSFTFMATELDILKHLNEVRLVVDLSPTPHLYTQIAAISAGIPQVNQLQTEFVEHLKNGFIVEKPEELSEALEHYLTGLRNWNQALVYAVQKIHDYTSGKLVKRMVDSI